MAATNLNIRMDKNVKDQAETIFNEAGIPNQKTIQAMKEAERIAKDSMAKSYTVDDAFMELAK